MQRENLKWDLQTHGGKGCFYSDISQQMSRGKCSRVFTAVLLVTTKPLEAAQQSEIENWLEKWHRYRMQYYWSFRKNDLLTAMDRRLSWYVVNFSKLRVRICNSFLKRKCACIYAEGCVYELLSVQRKSLKASHAKLLTVFIFTIKDRLGERELLFL